MIKLTVVSQNTRKTKGEFLALLVEAIVLLLVKATILWQDDEFQRTGPVPLSQNAFESKIPDSLLRRKGVNLADHLRHS